MIRIGIDAGGTFTDFVVSDGRSLDTFKIPSNPADPAAVILEGIRRVAAGVTARVVHGSTVATNALLEFKGARTAFVTTAGFEDLVLIGRQNRAELYNLTPSRRPHLVKPEECFGIRERMLYDGTVLQSPAARDLKQLKLLLRERGVESAAICLLHSYRNPEHERQVL